MSAITSPRRASAWSRFAALAGTVAALAVLCFSAPLAAREAAPLAEHPLTEKRMLAITAELRCLVCQNQSIADSNADLANDFRREIRHLIEEGRSDNEIMEFMVDRYGDFVRYRPPLKGTTVLLWAGPALLALLALLILVRYLRRRNASIGQTTLTPEEQRAAAAMLAAAPPPDDKKP